MAINPPSDIVLDVARAVDASGYSEAAGRLARLAGAAAPARPAASEQGFREAMDAAAPPSDAGLPPMPFDAAGAMVARQNRETLAASGPADTFQRFEAFVLQSVVQSILPESGAASFGTGTAGGIWRSMLAEQLGAQLAASGGIGIADMLAADHARTAPGAAGPDAVAGRVWPERRQG